MRAVIVESRGAEARLEETAEEGILSGPVELDVLYSSYNYKDGLAITGAGRGVLQNWPIIPGIDIVGTVTRSDDPAWDPGDTVVLNGDGIGESRNGGFATRARVRGEALVELPREISPVRAAAIGTAGFTAMISVLQLADAGLTPGSGDILVTGAAGGVGSVAVSLLAARGYRVVASTGRAEEEGDYLRDLGAADLLDRHELSEELGKPLQEQRWAGAVDVAGSTTLANVLAQTNYGGIVSACGLAQGMDLPTTVAPFILRGVTLTGANSVYAPQALRQRAWAALADELDLDQLDRMTTTIGLADTIPYAQQILAGRTRGRTVVDVNR
ncbi:MDR family oxidoreductase [Citricoccus sp.]|uniref:MDR family oxidoreductase n=1 Tax=Citricoccus sp. TaxID=1978372 RepID=UPI0026264F19|nr:MDR family oxidoreductase [Citricoccus sp.]HRO31521.1 MDR family oxidoreductase [Citricoccus sp.]HRO94860.1 MDR family oxidoreductase [Citricoccus sp.]